MFASKSLMPNFCSSALGVAVIGLMVTLGYAGTESNSNTGASESSVNAEAKVTESVSTARSKFTAHSIIRALIEQETVDTDLPADIAEAVVFVESNYEASTIGSVGEIGLMQVRPQTAAMMGFKGTAAELAKPELNIYYGVIYLSQAWHLAHGDLCRALMKYRAGHGEEVMSPLSVTYCNRARSRLAAMGSPYAGPGTWPIVAAAANTRPSRQLVRSMDVDAGRRGTPAASRAFWAAHEARIRAITARIESKWRRVASR